MDVFKDRLISDNDGWSGLYDRCGYCGALLLIFDQFILALDCAFTAIRGDATAAPHYFDASNTVFRYMLSDS